MMTITFFQNLKRFLGGLANSLTQWNNNFEVYNNQDYFITSRGALGGFADSAGVKSFTWWYNNLEGGYNWILSWHIVGALGGLADS